jgi:hypothetical protein
MLSNACSLAQRKLVQAFYHNGTLAIFATGTVPTPCHATSIKRAVVTVEPPQFTLVQCRRAGICSEVVTPYTLSQLFAIGTYRPVVAVTHAGGQDDVAVEHIREYHPQGQMSPLGSEVPMPYVFPPSTARNSSADGIATGYSTTFDFGDALREAIAALSPEPHTYADQLSTVTVLEVGAELGGIAGFHHLFVRVRREPDPLMRRRA